MNPTGRFTGRAALYARYRPGYPDDIFATLRQNGLPDAASVADLGAGTGISSEYFLRHGCRVTAVEPNDDMRHAAEDWLGARSGFLAVKATAEFTGLPAGEFDLAAAFQAAHWFDFDKAVAEMRRLAKPHGLLAMAWNLRSKHLTPFDSALESLLIERAVDYTAYEERRGASISALSEFRASVFPHEHSVDWEAFRGLVQSWSYVPPPGHPRHEWFFDGLKQLFEDHASAGFIQLHYDCHFYFSGQSG